MDKTKIVNSWNDLAQFGINSLTGEACRYSQRLVCDLNEDGRTLIAEYLGIDADALAAPWNSTVNGKPAVASVMLHRESLRQVAEFAFMHTGCLAYVNHASGLTGLYDAQRVEQYERLLPEGYEMRRNYAAGSRQPHIGSRNVHAATGRVM